MIYLLIPAHNEAENLPRLIDTWRQTAQKLGEALRFVVIDDGSTDESVSYLRTAGEDVEVHSLKPNRGPGGAFLHGFNLLLPRLKETDVLFTLEADNTSDAGIAGTMMKKLNDGADLVLAACYAEGGGIVGTTLFRIFLSSTANFMMKAAFRFPSVTTFTSFYRAWRPSLLKRISTKNGIDLRLHGFVCMAELLLLALAAGAKVVEVPMVLEGFQRKGPSNMKVVKTTAEYFRFLVIRSPVWLQLWLGGGKK